MRYARLTYKWDAGKFGQRRRGISDNYYYLSSVEKEI